MPQNQNNDQPQQPKNDSKSEPKPQQPPEPLKPGRRPEPLSYRSILLCVSKISNIQNSQNSSFSPDIILYLNYATLI